MKRNHTLRAALMLCVFAFGMVGCDTIEGIFENEQEATGIVEAVDSDGLTVDGIRYAVTADTVFEDGYDSLADVTVGDEVEVEYEEQDGSRVALEVEPKDGDDDGGLFG